MERGVAATTSYPRHGSFYSPGKPSGYSIAIEPTLAPEIRHRQQYKSDPTLLEQDRAVNREGQGDAGRRSAQDNYSYSYEAGSSTEKEARRSKKKKLKKFKNFMQVFIGGLRKHQSSQDSWDGGNVGHYRQKKIDSTSRSSDSGLPASPALLQGEQGSFTPSPNIGNPSHIEIPGLCGLYNHGNTCFMNAVLQCLSNTDQLAEYFVTDHYKNDLNRQKLSARTFGSSGDVTEQFAILLKCLWNCQYDPRVTSHFKDVIGRYASQYQGSSQHDAQEFFLWLLDSVHEDLNQAGRKKYRPIKVRLNRVYTVCTCHDV